MILRAVIIGRSWNIREVTEIQTGLGWVDGRKLLRPSPMDQALEIVYLGFEISVLSIESTNRSAQMLYILQKLILVQRHAEDYHNQVNLQAITTTSRYFRWLSDMPAIDPCPIQPGEQKAKLLGRHRHRTVPDRWPNELASLQPLRRQDHA